MAVVIDVDEIHLADRTAQVLNAGVIDASENGLGSAMAAPICPHLDSLQVHLERSQGQVSHFDRKASSSRQIRLMESDIATKRRLERTALAAFNVIENERLEEAVRLVAKSARDVYVRSLIQCCRPVVGVEEIDAKARHGKCCRFAAPWRTGYDEHPGRHLATEIAVRAFPHIVG